MRQTIAIRLSKDLAVWLEDTAAKSGVSQSKLVRDQLEKARTPHGAQTFMRLEPFGAPKISPSAKGFRAREGHRRHGFSRRFCQSERSTPQVGTECRRPRYRTAPDLRSGLGRNRFSLAQCSTGSGNDSRWVDCSGLRLPRTSAAAHNPGEPLWRSPADLADLCLIRMSELYPRHSVVTVDAEDFPVYRRNKRKAIPLICPAK